MRKLFAIFAFLAVVPLAPCFAADGAGHPMQDRLLDKMVGHWTLAGTIAGRPAHHTVDAQWILDHQFLQLHELGAVDPKTGKREYEALPTIGYDDTSERYVAHWLDVFGGRFSETLGYGTRKGDEILFVFEYPDGPFHTSFRWDGAKNQWRWQMKQKGQDGKWTPFADLVMSKI